jgi:hypothetical protein
MGMTDPDVPCGLQREVPPATRLLQLAMADQEIERAVYPYPARKSMQPRVQLHCECIIAEHRVDVLPSFGHTLRQRRHGFRAVRLLYLTSTPPAC